MVMYYLKITFKR